LKTKKKIIVLLLSVLLLTGCTKQLTDADGKVVKNEKTGQALTANILCKPTIKENLKIYKETREELIEDLDKQLENGDIGKKEHDKKIDELTNVEDLPACKNYKITSGGYEGIWTSIFIKPLAWLLIQIGNLVKNYGLAIILTTILIRLVIYPFTRKALHQSENLTKAKPELDKIEKKYKNKQDQQSLQMKSQEMLMVYKKHDIKPLSGCLLSFIQIPLFFAYYEALNRLPALYEDSLLGIKLNMAPWASIQAGNYLYLILPVLVLLVTYFSFKNNNTSGLGDQQKQMKTVMNIMIIMIFVMSFTLSSAIVIYWIANSAFTIIQNLLVKKAGKKA